MKRSIGAATPRSTTTASTLARWVQAEQNPSTMTKDAVFVEVLCICVESLRPATREERKWSWFPKPRPRPTHRGSAWPSTPGQGESTEVFGGRLEMTSLFLTLSWYKLSVFVCPVVAETNSFVQICNRVPELWSDLQKQTVLVRKPGSSRNSGEDRDPAHLAWGKLQA